MEGKVLGIGGLFFRARDPDALNAWYRDHLGVGAGCSATAEPMRRMDLAHARRRHCLRAIQT